MAIGHDLSRWNTSERQDEILLIRARHVTTDPTKELQVDFAKRNFLGRGVQYKRQWEKLLPLVLLKRGVKIQADFFGFVLHVAHMQFLLLAVRGCSRAYRVKNLANKAESRGFEVHRIRIGGRIERAWTAHLGIELGHDGVYDEQACVHDCIYSLLYS